MAFKRILTAALLLLIALAFSGCVDRYAVMVSNHGKPHKPAVVHAPAPGPGHGPPPWAPAHGRRAKYKYRYYPSHSVYFEPVRNVWFYLEGSNWRVGASLPGAIVLGASSYVALEMDVDKPYVHHHHVVKKHPKPKKKKKKGKGRGKHK
jgi:hypothetical protein